MTLSTRQASTLHLHLYEYLADVQFWILTLRSWSQQDMCVQIQTRDDPYSFRRSLQPLACRNREYSSAARHHQVNVTFENHGVIVVNCLTQEHNILDTVGLEPVTFGLWVCAFIYYATRADDWIKMSQIFQKCQHYWISLLYLESACKIHWKKCNHALYWFRKWSLKC